MESLEQLLEKQQELTSKIAALRTQQKKEALAEIISIVEKYEFTPDEVAAALGKRHAGGSKRKGGTVPPKYRDPATGATWTGRGKPPAWIAGKDRDAFLIA